MKRYFFVSLLALLCTAILASSIPTLCIFPHTKRQYETLLLETTAPAGESAFPIEKEQVEKILIIRQEDKEIYAQVQAERSYFVHERVQGKHQLYEQFLKLEGKVRETNKALSFFERQFSSPSAKIDYSQNYFEATEAKIRQGNLTAEDTACCLQTSYVDGIAQKIHCFFPKHEEMECWFHQFDGLLVPSGHVFLHATIPLLHTLPQAIYAFENTEQSEKIVFRIGEEDQFFCGKGVWDFRYAQGTFFSGEDGSPVQFFHTPVGREEQAVSFNLLAEKLIVHLADGKAEKAPLEFLKGIETIQAVGKVQIEYDENICVDAEEGLYRNGILTLWADPKKECSVFDTFGNSLRTPQMEVDFIASLLSFSNPKGCLFEENGEFLHINTDHLVWDPYGHRLTLMGRTVLDHSHWGREETIGEVIVHADAEEGVPKIQMIEAKGKNHFCFRQDPSVRQLFCTGTVLFDEKKGMIDLQSAPDAGSQAARYEQGVIFEDQWGKMFADKMEVRYHMQEKLRIVDRIHLFGHVALMNQFLENAGEEIPFQQYALADELLFYPETKEVVFMSKSPNRVLFFDKGNHLEMSAAGLKAWRDPLTHKDAFQGIGNVRFSLQEKELAQLKEHFQWSE